MTKLFETIVVGIASFIIAVFLPKQLITLIRELIKFIFSSIIKYWYLVMVITIALVYIIYRNNILHNNYGFSYKLICLIVSVVLIIITSFAYWKEVFINYNSLNIAIYGCFSVKESEYLIVDLDSESLNDRIEKIVNIVISDFFVYRNNLLQIKYINVPKFIPIILGYTNLNKFIKKRINAKNHLAAIHFIRDINKQNVSVILNINQAEFYNTIPIINAENLINSLSTDTSLNSNKIIEISIKIYLLLFGQGLLDVMIDHNDFRPARYVLDDTNKLIISINDTAKGLINVHKNEIDNFLNYWSSHVERYKSIILIQQKQYSAAIQYIIKSIKLNPYYPYDSYNSLKSDYTKKYGIELASTFNEIDKIIESSIDVKTSEAISKELANQVQYASTTFNYEIIKEILRHDDTNETSNLLLNELNNIDESNPFIILTKIEVIKYMKKGTEKFNEIYVDRLDECINMFKEAIKLDGDFPLLYTRMGIMLTIKGMYFGDEQMIEDGLKEYKKGMYFISELGFDQ